MHLTDQVLAEKHQFLKLMNEYPADEPVVMVNLLKFKARSDNGDESGEAAYQRYSKNVLPLLDKVGGRVVWSGSINMTVIGDLSDQPDMVLVVEYPSVAKFVEMATSNAYRTISHDREIALTYGGLLASSSHVRR